MATPGNYSASLHIEKDGVVSDLDGPVEFKVIPIHNGVLKGSSYEKINSFRISLTELQSQVSGVQDVLNASKDKHKAMSLALSRSKIKPGLIEGKLADLKTSIYLIETILSGSDSKSAIGERNPAGMQSYLRNAMNGLRNSYGPTGVHRKSFETAKEMLISVKAKVINIEASILPIEAALKNAGAPHINGQGVN